MKKVLFNLILAILFCSNTSLGAQTTDERQVEFIRSYGVSESRAKYIVSITHLYSRLYKVPTNDMIALMAVESSFNANATSSKGASGLVQHIDKWHPEKVIFIKQRLGYYNQYDIPANILMGVLIAKEYRAKYGRKWLQAYNGSLHDRSLKFTKNFNKTKGLLLST